MRFVPLMVLQVSWDTKVYRIRGKCLQLSQVWSLSVFFLALVMKMSSNLALTLMLLHNKSRENRVMSYQTFLTSGQDATRLLFRLGQIWEKWWNMMLRQLFVLLNCYISQHTLRVIYCLSPTLHFELIKASISMTWCHHSLSLIFHHSWIPESRFA